MPVYECSNCYNEFSEQLYPVNISDVKWINLICDKYPNGCIQITCHDAQENAYYATRLLKCYVSKKGKVDMQFGVNTDFMKDIAVVLY